MSFIGLSKVVETVIHQIHIGEPAVCLDHLIDANVQQHGRGMFSEVYKYISKNLASGRNYEDLAGTKVLPMAGRKRTEAWAKNRNFKTARMRNVMPSWKPTWFDMLSALITESEQMPIGSPRRLSASMVRHLSEARRYVVPPESVGPLAAVIQQAMNEIWTAQATARGLEATSELARDNAMMANKLLSYRGDDRPQMNGTG